jgi:succinyl-diaminopimelate desuccinylase
MNKREQEALSSMDTDKLIELTQKLIRIPSVNPPGEYNDISVLFYDRMRSMGLNTAILEGKPGKPNVLGMLPGTDPKASVLLLSGHMDVVSASNPSAWRYDPFGGEIHEDKIWGRGAIDMKGALAAAILALESVMKAGVQLRGTVILGATVDDETAGPWGMKYVINRGLDAEGWPQPTVHVLGEANNLNITGAFKGRLWVKISVGGKSAHGGEPEAGINAIEKMLKLILNLNGLCRRDHPLMGRETLNIGKILGGEVVNVVPSGCTVHIDFRMCSPGNADEGEKRLRNIIRRLEKEDPDFHVEELEIYEIRDPVEISREHSLIQTMAQCVENITGRKPEFEGSLSAGDLYHVLKMGIPGAWIGAGNGSLRHAKNEHIAIQDLIEMTQVYILLILRLCA